MNINTIVKNLIVAIFVFFINSTSYASTGAYIDVFGTKQLTSEQIYKNCSKELKQITPDLIAAGFDYPERFGKVLGEFTEKVHKMGDFAYFSVSPIFYSDRKNIYITVDAIDKKDKDQIPTFLPKPTKTFKDPNNLIAEWQVYERMGLELMV